jgi:hypothetical protein
VAEKLTIMEEERAALVKEATNAILAAQVCVLSH